MNKGSTLIIVGTILAVTIVSTVFYASAHQVRQADILTVITPTMLPLSSETPSIVAPVAHFLDRAATKPFGIFITPDTSPIKNDYHNGYHTGIDVEFTDTIEDVPVYAIADGTIVVRKWVKGYGGVIVILHTINDVPLYALYGHLDEASFISADVTHATMGQQIAILGDDHSHETDGVRKHLHFSISTADRLDLRGYVQTEAELSHWLNPLDLY
jgi:murein DD-endopeptidase MepM/ murein hydrolase activator NlpD